MHYYLPYQKVELTDLIVSRHISVKFYKKNCAKCECCSKAERIMKSSYKVECCLNKSKVSDIHERIKLYSCGDKMPSTPNCE